MAGRKPTPVDVVYFPRRPRSAARAVTQTMPEVRADDAEVVTEVEVALEAVDRKRPRERKPKPRPKPKPGPGRESRADMAALGHELFTRGKVREARVVFEGLLVANPHDSFALTMLGTVHLALREPGKALQAFERALALDPEDVAARVYRGELRLGLRRNKGALDDFARALASAAPGDPFAARARRLTKVARARVKAVMSGREVK